MIRISFYRINIYGYEEILNRGSEFWRIREKNIIFSAHESKYESTRCTIDSSTADFSTRLWYLYSVTRTNSFLHTIPTSQLYFFLLLFSSTPIRFLFSSFSCSLSSSPPSSVLTSISEFFVCFTIERPGLELAQQWSRFKVQRPLSRPPLECF